ncbi:hypothetical protein C2G38_2151473 [Gigaspora rosea]|uniref:Uncharacterized protein n=1 Tax=Gigaspora rosea TaxID=44941 RepID=A0A397WE78_9GLOM|nr:hypothetical protein C2G38_2151473 [Gigaspora rosea]
MTLLKQHRSLRSALTTLVKDAIFSVFGESQLDSINTNVTSADVWEWKASAKMKACHQKLFTPISSDPNDLYMSRILSKVWSDKLPTNIKMAYAIAVCQIMLNDYYKKLTMSEDTVKDRLRKIWYRKMQQKKPFLLPGEGESTEDEEDEVVEEERGRGKKRRKPQQSESSSRKGKHVRRTKSPINISDAETSQATPKATLEATQEEPPEGSTASAGHLAEPPEGSTASAGHLATHDEPQEGSSTASAGHLATHDA